MFELEEKSYFIVLAVIPILAIAFLLLILWKRKKQKQFAEHSLFKKLSPNTSVFKSVVKLVLWSFAITCISIALVNPKFGTKLETVKREGVDIVFAVDVSKSMLAEDIAPSRIDKSKQLVTQIINNLASDRIGIIAYAGQAYPQLPITTDYASAKMFLQNMNTNMLSSQGTAISDAIELATTYFNDDAQTNRILFIISDGEDHSENALEAATLAAKEGIKIFTIGVGKTEGAPIPIKRNGIIESYKKDRRGETVITKLNDVVLREIATNANGKYINGLNTQKVVEEVKDTLLAMDKKEFETKQYSEFSHQFQWFLGFGLFFLLIDILVLERKTEWIKKLNLFNE
ncbi:VWA domain-containing protein [Pseudofulvibacter geojedonensis]|uniref:VWA domain-containing protein n=1 Tax=Pseudofulvibacter geojedonensis TaxID=1123758 RepID=A0ABW3I031_9FLAO